MRTKTDNYTPQYWLHRAVEARRVAGTFTDERARSTMMQIAEAYEKLAGKMIEIEARRNLVEKGVPPRPGTTAAGASGSPDLPEQLTAASGALSND